MSVFPVLCGKTTALCSSWVTNALMVLHGGAHGGTSVFSKVYIADYLYSKYRGRAC